MSKMPREWIDLFLRQKGCGQRGAEILDRHMAALGLKVEKASTDDDWRGIDRWMALGTRRLALQYKYSPRSAETGNVFIELFNSTGRLGWAYDKATDIYLFLLSESGPVVSLTRKVLQRELTHWVKEHSLLKVDDGPYLGIGVLVPIETVMAVGKRSELEGKNHV